MATAQPTIVATFVSSADLSSSKYRCVYISGDGTVTFAPSATALASRPIGILTDDVGSASGDAVSVQLGGLAKVEAGDPVAAGSALSVDSAGRVVRTTTANQYTIGIATTAAGASGDIITCVIAPGLIA